MVEVTNNRITSCAVSEAKPTLAVKGEITMDSWNRLPGSNYSLSLDFLLFFFCFFLCLQVSYVSSDIRVHEAQHWISFFHLQLFFVLAPLCFLVTFFCNLQL